MNDSQDHFGPIYRACNADSFRVRSAFRPPVISAAIVYMREPCLRIHRV